MSVSGGNLTILVAPGGVLTGIREVLQDWSAEGLVQQFCWLEDPVSDVEQIMGTFVDQGRLHPVHLVEHLASREHTRIRLCILVPGFTGAATVVPEVEQRLATLVRSNGGSARPELIRCVVVRPGVGPGSGQVAREGWHNVVLSPEDARGPDLAHRLLSPTRDPLDVGLHAAPDLAGLLGLWSGIDDAPLDDERPPPGRMVRVARSFVRHLDAGGVEAVLRERVLSGMDELPLPRVGSGRAATITDVAAASSGMASRFWSKHRDVLLGPRESVPLTAARKIKVLEALRMLFGFLAASLRNAPHAWYLHLRRRAASAVATGVQRAVFGQASSAYEVIMAGTRQDGTRADWRDLSTASLQVGEQVDQPSFTAEQWSHADLSRVWQDYVAAAFTLADAGARSPALPPVVVGVDHGVVRRPEDCAPSPSADFTLIPETLRSRLPFDRLAPADVLGTQAVRDRLAELEEDPVLASEASRTLSALDQWASRHRASFAVQASGQLAAAVTELVQEVRSLLTALVDAAGASEPSAEELRGQRRLARLARVLAVALLVVLAGLVLLVKLDVLSWSRVALWSAGAVVVWLVSAFVVFLRGQRDLFSELHRREQMVAEAEVNRRNLAYALGDLRRTSDAYAQLLEWTRVIGSLVAQPFGAVALGLRRRPLGELGLPLAMRVGVAEPEEPRLATTVALVRRRIYRDGWLSQPWESVLAEMPARLGVEGLDLREDPSSIFLEPAGEGTVLQHWVDLFCEQGPGLGGGEAVWQQVLASFAPSEEAATLLQRVAVGSSGHLEDRGTFMAGIEERLHGPVRGVFDPYIFSAVARTEALNAVRTAWGRSVQTGLSEISIMVELTDGVPDYELDGLEQTGPEGGYDVPPGAVF